MKYIYTCTFVLLVIAGCNETGETIAEKKAKDIEIFYGKITYATRIESADPAILQTIAQFPPEKTELYFAKNKFRMIEYGGASHGNILIYPDVQEAWQLDTASKIAWLGEYSDFSDPGDELMDMMPDHFSPVVESTKEKETIMGVECTKYKVLRSGFIPADNEAYIWVTTAFRLPSSRFDIQTEINRVIVPLPLYLGFEDGAVMRMKVSNKNYAAVYEVTEMQKSISDENIFSIPADYAKK